MRLSLSTMALLMLLTSAVTADDKTESKDKPKEEASVKTVDVEVKGGLVLKVPEAWKKEKPSSNFRLIQFSIPAAEGDKDSGELALFKFGGGGGQVKANIDRWIGQFHADGRKAKVTQGQMDDGKYYFVELSGTFNKPVGPPIQRRSEPTAGYRMLGVILGVESGIYYFKMTGPDKTVAKEGTSLRVSFGADAEKEKAVELDELK